MPAEVKHHVRAGSDRLIETFWVASSAPKHRRVALAVPGVMLMKMIRAGALGGASVGDRACSRRRQA